MMSSGLQISTRRGITLMEVLIAIGILSIGLTSVAALLPAGGSQARKAIISDRAANLAENALADAVTIGLTRPLSLSGTAAIGTVSRVVIDPAGALELPGTSISNFSLQASGVLSTATGGAKAADSVVKLFSQGRDDVVFTPSESEDGLPSNLFIDGTRAFDGRTSCLWAIESLDGGQIIAGKLARLSVVVFHDRDQTDKTLAGWVSDTSQNLSPGEIKWQGNLPGGRSVRDVFRTGTVIVAASAANEGTKFFSLRSASPNADNSRVYGVFDQQPPAGAITVLLDSVGLAQAIVTLEGPGPFSSTVPREVVP